MKKIRFLLILLFFFGFAVFFFGRHLKLTYAGTCEDQYAIDTAQYTNCKQKEGQIASLDAQIKELEQKLADTKKQEGDIKQNIDYLDNEIYLSKLKISESEVVIEKHQQDIENLTNNILLLEESLNKNTKLFLKRVNLSYRQGNISTTMVFFGNGNIADKINKFKYLQIVQTADRQFLFKIQETKNSYASQKKLVEQEKKALEGQKIVLEEQKQVLGVQVEQKQVLLADTQNKEKNYQDLLSRARSEYDAIQGILSGDGEENFLREVKKNDIIANLISGPSCNSSGGHLHFIIEDNGANVNPFSYLKSVDFSNCSGSSCGSGDGDPFNPTGNLDWPLSPLIELEQGYGATWSVRNTWVGQIYSFHNGIDINGSSNDVHAVDDGLLYKGNYSGSNSCALYYVKLKHKNSNVVSYYLHVYAK